MEGKKVLITGGAGFIGSNLALALEEKYPKNRYFIVDNFSSGHSDNLIRFKGKVINEDISKINFNRYFPEGIDIIFHQAAITDTTVTDENEMMSKNIGGFQNILDFTFKNKARLIYASSAGVYGNSPPPMRVGEGEKPVNIYGLSKLKVDNLARKHFDTYQDNVIIGLRYFNVYGPGEKYKGKVASMIWQLYLQMKEGKRPRIFKYGEQKRDHVYIKDVVTANLLALKATKSGIVNIGTGKAITFNEIIENLNEIMNKNLKPEYIDNPYEGNYQNFTQADLSEAKERLNYQPQYDLKQGIWDYLSNKRLI